MSENTCPKCARPIATRRHKKCSYCGAILPEELLFSDEEKRQVEAENRKLYEELLEAVEKNKEAERRANDALDAGMNFGSGGGI